MDLGVSDMERPCTDYVKHGFIFYAHRSNYEGVVGMMFDTIFIASALLIMALWWIVKGEDDV